MGLFSSSKSSSKSSSADNRSMASDSAIAAGGNSGSISRDIFGDHIASSPLISSRAVFYAVAAGLILWGIPKTRNLIKKMIG